MRYARQPSFNGKKNPLGAGLKLACRKREGCRRGIDKSMVKRGSNQQCRTSPLFLEPVRASRCSLACPVGFGPTTFEDSLYYHQRACRPKGLAARYAQSPFRRGLTVSWRSCITTSHHEQTPNANLRRHDPRGDGRLLGLWAARGQHPSTQRTRHCVRCARRRLQRATGAISGGAKQHGDGGGGCPGALWRAAGPYPATRADHHQRV